MMEGALALGGSPVIEVAACNQNMFGLKFEISKAGFHCTSMRKDSVYCLFELLLCILNQGSNKMNSQSD